MKCDVIDCKEKATNGKFCKPHCMDVHLERAMRKLDNDFKYFADVDEDSIETMPVQRDCQSADNARLPKEVDGLVSCMRIIGYKQIDGVEDPVQCLFTSDRLEADEWLSRQPFGSFILNQQLMMHVKE